MLKFLMLSIMFYLQVMVSWDFWGSRYGSRDSRMGQVKFVEDSL